MTNFVFHVDSPVFGSPFELGLAEGALSLASMARAYAACFSLSKTTLVKISPVNSLISKKSLPSEFEM
jgi:hypothetical protein